MLVVASSGGVLNLLKPQNSAPISPLDGHMAQVREEHQIHGGKERHPPNKTTEINGVEWVNRAE